MGILGIVSLVFLVAVCVLVIDRIAYAVKKRLQKRINDSFKEEAG